MLTIRGDQFDVFRRAVDATILDEAAELLRAEFPDAIAGLPDDVFRARLERGLRRARELDFKTDVPMIVFIAMMFRFGPEFDRHPVVARCLADGPGLADDRMLNVVLELPDRVWEELAILADDDWGDGFDSNGEAD